MVSLDRFDTFKAVVEAGSLTAAADPLGQTRAVVSFNLKRLEDELGVTLLTRNTRQLALTDAGERFYRRCMRTLDEARLADRRGPSEHCPAQGHLAHHHHRGICVGAGGAGAGSVSSAAPAIEHSPVHFLHPRGFDLRTLRRGDAPGAHARFQSARGAVVDVRGVCGGGAGASQRWADRTLGAVAAMPTLGHGRVPEMTRRRSRRQRACLSATTGEDRDSCRQLGHAAGLRGCPVRAWPFCRNG